jgi:hypothetical protein
MCTTVLSWGEMVGKEGLLLVAYSETELMVDSLSMSPFLSLLRSKDFPYRALAALKHPRDSPNANANHSAVAESNLYL